MHVSLRVRMSMRACMRSQDMMDQAIAAGATADEAEEMAMEQLRELGGDVLTDWA
jgi:hypothetical protein